MQQHLLYGVVNAASWKPSGPSCGYFLQRISSPEENYADNDKELFDLIYFLKRFRLWFEGAEFEALTYNQVLKGFFPKSAHRQKETR